MNTRILNNTIQEYLLQHLDSDTDRIVLQPQRFEGVTNRELVQQIISRNKCRGKLPTWFETAGLYYPPSLSLEQSSSEVTASYKTGLVSGSSLFDLTGGFGVDSAAFAGVMKQVVHCEIDPELQEISAHNHAVLGLENIESIQTDGIEWLRTSERKADWIYIDPSRRRNDKGKVILLQDCVPDIVSHLDLVFEHCKNLMIKTSPLLDIAAGLSMLRHVKAIHVVAVNNEVKELLWILERGYTDKVSTIAVNLKSGTNQIFRFDLEEEATTDIQLSAPLTYLYEPNAAILKAGAFKSVGKQYGLLKIHKHSHLYTSNDLIDFPGRRFKIEQVIPYQKRKLKKLLGMRQANISTRNFPVSVASIRKLTAIKDGGENYLFFTTGLEDQKVVLVTKKIT